MWPFRKKAPLARVIDLSQVTVTWRPGDMAECIKDDWKPAPGCDALPSKYPALGDKLMVTMAEPCRIQSLVSLEFVGYGGWRWASSHFRKIVATGGDRKVKLTAPRPKADA